MRRALILASALALTAASAARAQDPHAGHHHAPAAPPKPQTAPATAPPADPHAGHVMPAPAAPTPDLHAGHAVPPAATPSDPHAGHGGSPPSPAGAQAEPPPIPTDFDADRFFGRREMDAARAQLAREHGGMAWSKVLFEKLEYRSGSPDSYAWEGRASFGGDIDRFILKSRGEGDRKLEHGEIGALWARAISPWFNLEAGVRQDLQEGGRTYGVLGLDGLARYEFDVDAALFLSTHGDLSARVEASHAYRLTQRLVLEPRAEAELAASTVPSQDVGSGLSRVELGLRLRYAVTPEFAPYIGVEYERAFGRTERLLRTHGEDPRDTRLVIGLRSWF